MYKEKIGKIYKYTNKLNGKNYIGFTEQDVKKRKWRHQQKLKRHNTYFYNAINKDGLELFDFEIIYMSKDLIHCKNVMEPYFIKEYTAFWKDGGYNMTLGGEGSFGFKHSEETKNKMKINRVGKNKGRKVSEKSRQAMSESSSLEYIITDPNGIEFKIKGLIKFCKENNLNEVMVYRILQNKSSHKGFKCRYFDENYERRQFKKSEEAKAKQRKTYKLTEISSNKEIITNNLRKSCEENNIKYYGIMDVLCGKQNLHRGWKCEHYKEI